MPNGLGNCNRVVSVVEMSKLSGGVGKCGVNEKPLEARWQRDGGEKKSAGGKDTSGRSISGVDFARDVSVADVGATVSAVEKIMDPPEDCVDGTVSTAAVPPSTHNAFIVPVSLEMPDGIVRLDD